MGRSPCCDEIGLKKGPWTPEEDKKLTDYIQNHGHGSWRNLPRNAGLNRCGKSCRLRWANYLRPDIKRGKFSEEEEGLIIHLHSVLGNKWSTIATRLPGRTDNEIKNYWNTHLRKKLLLMGIDPVTHRRRTDLDLLAGFPNLIATTSLGKYLPNPWDRLQQDAAQLARSQLLQSLIQLMATSSPPNFDALNPFASAAIRSYQMADLLQLNRQLEGLISGSLGLSQDPIMMPPGLSLLGIQQLGNDFQAFPQTDGSCSTELARENNCVGTNGMSSSYNIPTADSTPSLIPASPENVTTDQTLEPINSVDASASSYTSITSETWEALINLGDLDEDLSWKDILDQTKWSNEKQSGNSTTRDEGAVCA